MAFYKQDIVDVNLETGVIHRSFLNHTIGHKDDDADRFGIRAFRNGEPVDLSGAQCQAIFMAPDGTNIALTSYGTVSGNEAYVTLPQACYNVEGQFCLAIKLVGDGVTATVRIIDGVVDRTGATGAVAPTEAVPTYQEILAVYAEMQEDVADYESVVATQNGKIDDLKSALDIYTSWYTITPNVVNGYFIDNRGDIYENADYSYSDFFATKKYDEFVFILQSEYGIVKQQWLQMCFYNSNTEEFVSRQSIIGTSASKAIGRWVNNTERGDYLLRLTWNNASNTTLTILKIPNNALFEENIFNDIREIKRRNQEQILIPLTNIKKSIDANYSIGYAIDVTPRENIAVNSGIIDCSEGDVFTVTGQSSAGTCLWAFIDSENKIIKRSATNAYAYQMVIEAPPNASKLIINVLLNTNYSIYRGSGSTYIDFGTRLSKKNYNQHYINTNVNAFEPVDLTPIYFSSYCCAVIDCVAGETFTISGRGGGSGRLWAFLNYRDELLFKSAPNENMVAESLTAPTDATKLVINSVNGFMVCYKGNEGRLSNDILLNSIPIPIIHNMPKDVVAMPSVYYSSYVQSQSNVAGAKPTIYKNGDYYCVIYGENINNSSTDIPMFAGNGVLAMRYKTFKLVNGVESEVEYGTIAQQGSSYIDYNGNTATMTGGAGLPSGVDNMQYFTTPYLKDDGDDSYTFAGIPKYGMTPCCCSVSVSDSGVTFGTINELKLYANDEWGKFDMHRIDSSFYNELTYLTTSPPYHDTNGYKWLQPVTNGIAYLTSSDGISWIYRFTVKTPYQPRFEVTCTYKNNMMYFAARSNTRTQLVTDTLYVGKISTSGCLALEYKLPFVETRPWITKSGDDILLFYTPANKQIAECIRICEYGGEFFFWRWFTIFKNSTWYITCLKDTVENKIIEKMYLAGGNSQDGSTGGMTFMELIFNTSKPYTPADIPAMVLPAEG